MMMNAAALWKSSSQTTAIFAAVVVPRIKCGAPSTSSTSSSSSQHHSLTFVRCMSKYLSKSATKRLPLTTKRARKGYYKGKGSTKEGHLTSKNKFVVDYSKRLELVVPDLTGFKLKPYIASTVSKFPPDQRRSPV